MPSAVELANARMTIIQACAEVGVDVPDFSTGSIKTYCPFGQVFHSDGGWSKAFRVYPASNSAHCFAGCGFFTPVKLIARANNWSDAEAAQVILEKTNYVPPDYASQWEALTQSGEAIDLDGLGEALKVACARMDPSWEERQFDQQVSVTLSRCLDLLPKVKTSTAAQEWLGVSKQVMQRVLGSAS